MPDYDEVIQTPLTQTFQQLRELAKETKLLSDMDIVALEKLAVLNAIQQIADRGDGPDQQILRTVFGRLYTWLHETNKYFIHHDERTGVWRLGTELSRKGGGC
jgi:hypothetical protein